MSDMEVCSNSNDNVPINCSSASIIDPTLKSRGSTSNSRLKPNGRIIIPIGNKEESSPTSGSNDILGVNLVIEASYSMVNPTKGYNVSGTTESEKVLVDECKIPIEVNEETTPTSDNKDYLGLNLLLEASYKMVNSTKNYNLSVNTEPEKILVDESETPSEGILIISLIGLSREDKIICKPEVLFNLIANSEFGPEILSNPRYKATTHEIVLNIKDSKRIPYLLGIKELKDNDNCVNWPIECYSPICSGCDVSEYNVVARCYRNDEESLKVFRHHGILPLAVTCPKCSTECSMDSRHNWQCHRTEKRYKRKGYRKCGFQVTDYKGTFMNRCKLRPWQVLLFVNMWLRKHFTLSSSLYNFQISTKSSIDWKSMCSEVTQFWFNNQQPIGGENIVVEIDEILFLKSNKKLGTKQVWLFGGIERESKRCIVVPIVNKQRCEKTIISLIEKYVAQNSIICSEKWKDYSLNEKSYVYMAVKHNKKNRDSKNASAHIQCIKRVWSKMKDWILGPGIQRKNLKEYISRYLFLQHCKKGAELHNFLVEVAKLYRPQSEEKTASILPYEDSVSQEEKASKADSSSEDDSKSMEASDSEEELDSETEYLEKVFGVS